MRSLLRAAGVLVFLAAAGALLSADSGTNLVGTGVRVVPQTVSPPACRPSPGQPLDRPCLWFDSVGGAFMQHLPDGTDSEIGGGASGIAISSSYGTATWDDLGSDANSLLFFKVQPAEAGSAPHGWGCYQSANPSGSRKNQVCAGGANVGALGNPIVPGEAMAGWSIEGYYSPDANKYTEMHWVMTNNAGTVTRRPLSVQGDRSTGFTSLSADSDFATLGRVGATGLVVWGTGFGDVESPDSSHKLYADNNQVLLYASGTPFLGTSGDPSGFVYLTRNLLTSFAKDNLIDLGDADQRWRSLHLGTSIVVHSDATDTNKITVSGTATGARTLTLPDATDTLVGRATAETLSNKTVASPVLSGSATGTYTIAGTPTLGASLALDGDARSIGDSTHRLANAYALGVQSGASTLTLTSGQANATDVAFRLTTTNGYAATTKAIFAINTNSQDVFRVFSDNGPDVYVAGYRYDTGAFMSGWLFQANKVRAWSTGTVSPQSNLGSDLGASGDAWSTSWVRSYAGIEKVVASTATPAFDCKGAGEYVRMIMTANVTSFTMTSGNAGEVCTLTFKQDGTGGRTIAGIPANTKPAGGAMATSAGANAVDSYTFRWDATDSVWTETSRSLNK